MKRRVNWLRVAVITVLAGGGLLGLAALLPLPPGLEASTLCYPIVGPVTRIASDLADSARQLAVAHEEAHAEQCRALGALRIYAQQVSPRRRAMLELQAFCAEVRVERGWGRSHAEARERVLDELASGYRWFRGLPAGELAARFDATCPPDPREAAGRPQGRRAASYSRMANHLLVVRGARHKGRIG